MTRLLLCLMLGVWAATGSSWAEEIPAHTDGRAAQDLKQRLEALERLDAELLDAQQQLEAAAQRQQRRELKRRVRELRTEREVLLDELDTALLGPQVSEAGREPTSIFEEQLTRRRQHREVILDDHVDSRSAVP